MSEQKKLTEQQLAFYLGCDVQSWEGVIYKLEGIDSVLREVHIRQHGENRGYWELVGNVKPVLRPLSSITEEEKNELDTFVRIKSLDIKLSNKNPADFWKHYAIITEFYLKKHFDLFNWIEQGLAVDKTKIK